MGKVPDRKTHRLRYPRDLLDPKQWLNFVELDPFAASWKRLGLGDSDLRLLQIAICAWPEHAPVMAGTGGLRKLRFAPGGWKGGKSGAARVYYAYFPEFGLVALIYAHAKDEMETIDAATRNEIKALIQQVHRYLVMGSNAGKRGEAR